MSEITYPWEMSIYRGGMLSVVPERVSVKSEVVINRLFMTGYSVRPKSFSKKKLPCWSPALYKSGDKRANANVIGISALVYDFDDTRLDPSSIIAQLGSRKKAFVIHTTWSHKPRSPRFRLVLFLDRMLTPLEYPTAWERAIVELGYENEVDTQAKDLARHYALPAIPNGAEYIAQFGDGEVFKADEISKVTVDTSERIELLPTTELEITEGTAIQAMLVRDLVELGPAKYKCKCPFQDGSSAGSAFFRVLKDGRAFIRCTSANHAHAGKQFWLSTITKKKSNRYASRSVDDRIQYMSELPDWVVEYVEQRLVYNALQGVFYRYADGAWQLRQPFRKESLIDHLIGPLPKGFALIDHILSRQVYGFDCQSVKDKLVTVNNVPQLNLYAWPDLIPQQGPWPRIRQVMEVLTHNDQGAFDWLMHWCAALIQNPARRSMVAVLVLSPQQGIGKSLFGRLLAEMIGPANTAVVSNRALKDSFNSHYVTKLLVLADEVGMGHKADDVLAEIKAAITDDRVHCSTPYAARMTIENRMSWWMTSNKRRPFTVEKGDRRFTIFSPAKVDAAYRTMLRKCFDPETSSFATDFYVEIQGLAHELKQVDIDWQLIAYPYSNTIKKELQYASLNSADAFIEQLKYVGPSQMIAGYPPPHNYIHLTTVALGKAIPCETLYGCYREWCSREGRTGVYSEPLFRLSIKTLNNVKVRRARIPGKGTLAVYTGLPSIKEKTKNVVLQFSEQQE